jgi:hypothetical protein
VRRYDARSAALAQRCRQTLCRSNIETAEWLIGDEQIGRCDKCNECRRCRSLATAKGGQAAVNQGNVNGDVTRGPFDARAHFVGGGLSRLERKCRIV